MQHVGERRLMRVICASAVAFVLAAGPLAQSGSAADFSGFSGMGTGFALRTVVDLSGMPDVVKDEIETAYSTLLDSLPAEAQALLPESFPFEVDQRFLETLTEMGAAQKAQAFLSRGLVEVAESAEATDEGQSDAVATEARSLPSDDLSVLDVAAGELLASVGAGPKVAGSGTLTSVSATLDALATLIPLNPALADLETALDGVVSEVNANLAAAQSTLDGLLGDVATGLVDQLTEDAGLGDLLDTAGLGGVLGGTDPVADATALAGELADALQLGTVDDLLSGALASIDDLENSSLSEKTAEKAMSDASSQIGAVDVLGLLQATAIDLASHSEAGGVSGSASNDSSCSIGNVKVGGTDGLSLNGDSLTVAGTQIPVPVDQIDAVKGVVDDVLAAIGVVGDVGLCDKESEADADGTSAAQRVSAFHVELALAAPDAVGSLIGAGDELVRIVIDPSVETAAAATIATAGDPEVSLPRTGAAAVASLLSGIALAGGALVLRRRIR